MEVCFMITTISKWGNGHAIRLSKELMQQAKLHPNDKIKITVTGEEIILKKVIQTKAEAFDETFSDYKGDWSCTEIGIGKVVGNEVFE